MKIKKIVLYSCIRAIMSYQSDNFASALREKIYRIQDYIEMFMNLMIQLKRTIIDNIKNRQSRPHGTLIFL